MKNDTIYSFDTVVVGTGAAGYSAACRIAQDGRKTVAIISEGIQCGTSRNTGSDKQTYYKLSLSGGDADSVRSMACDLFSGGSVDGDNALCEAALSTRCFHYLCELGVPFPVNRYGEYVGYKTDHDPYARATSAGPLTSKYMTEALEAEARRYQIPVYDGLLAIEILKDAQGVCGLLCLACETGEYVLFRCPNVILATGGPAGIYADSVYPECHTGSTGLALYAGASLQNMTEWQYGLASIAPRWNVSGTYMQVLPCFISVDEDGNEREFLLEYFKDPYLALSTIFLKGYQWPFDCEKIMHGSSVIDILVYRECVIQKRKVYLDYTRNPFNLEQIDYQKLSMEAFEYLSRAGACFGSPIERLQKMNMPAITLYQSKGLDITTQRLEIALCAQHNNGGIAVNMWWQTEIAGLYAVGECAGTHGVVRPGGSALNAGQVGAYRAAQSVCTNERSIKESDFRDAAEKALDNHKRLHNEVVGTGVDIRTQISMARRRMSDCGAAIRNVDEMQSVQKQIKNELEMFSKWVRISSTKELYLVYKLLDLLNVQFVTLIAMVDYVRTVGSSRGSALYTDPTGDLRTGLEELFRFCEDSGNSNSLVQQIRLELEQCYVQWRPVRPIPDGDSVFENVWRQYRINQNVY